MSQEIGNLISQYDDELSLESAGGGGFERPPSLEALENGTYTFTIKAASTDVINGTPVVRMMLETKGVTYEHLYWLGNQIAVNLLGQALVCLKVLPAEFSGKFSQVVGKCVARLAGIKATGKKGIKKGDTKDFVTFYWQSFVSAFNGAQQQPQRPQSAPQQAARRSAPVQPPAHAIFEGAEVVDDDIPF